MDVDRYVAVFNAAVRSGDWAAFVDQFDDDATVEFIDVPVGPFVGRAAISDAYAASPPDDTIEVVNAPSADQDETTVAFRWVGSGATGTMRLTEREGVVHRLAVSFDPPDDDVPA